jgi:hypothetical protein
MKIKRLLLNVLRYVLPPGQTNNSENAELSDKQIARYRAGAKQGDPQALAAGTLSPQTAESIRENIQRRSSRMPVTSPYILPSTDRPPVPPAKGKSW